MTASVFLDQELIGELKEIMADGFVTLVESYEQDTAKRLADMRQALAHGDLTLLAQLAHSLKGSSSNLGAIAVTEHCLVLEEAATAGGGAAFADLIDRLEATHELARQGLRQHVDG